MPPMVKDWDLSYREQATPWDLRGITPPLRHLAEAGFFTELELSAGARIAVPGCGRGHDLRLFAGLGFAVTGFDIAPSAVDEARRLLALNRSDADVLCRDVFGLLPEFDQAFDLVFDYTCFCAIPPHLRLAFGAVMGGLLRSRAWLLTLAFPMGGPLVGCDRPPYLVTQKDLDAAFGPAFERVRSLPAIGSVADRAGHETFYLWRRR